MEKPAFWVLACFFAFSTFAFGCMEGWSITVCECILFVGAAVAGRRNPDFWRFPILLRLPALVVSVFLVVGLVQLIPLPTSAWSVLDDDRGEMEVRAVQSEALLRSEAYREHPFYPGTVNASEQGWETFPTGSGWKTASFTLWDTLRALVALLAVGALLLLLENMVSSDRRTFYRLAWFVSLCGAAAAAIALIQHGDADREKILWLRESAYAARTFGPFVNANHGQAFVNLTLPLLYFLLWRRSLRTHHLSERLGALFILLALLILHLVLFLNRESEGAFLGLAFLALAGILHAGYRWRPVFKGIAAVLTASLLGGAGWLAWNGLLTSHNRMQFNANMPFDHWMIGRGLGSFPQTYPAVVSDWPLFDSLFNSHLENEYLQAFFEGGILPAGALIVAAALVLWTCYEAVTLPGPSFWIAAALASETVRVTVDFSFHAFPVAGVFLLLWMMIRREVDMAHEEGMT